MQLITIIITRLLFLSSALGLKPVSINSVPRINPDLSNGLKTLRRHFVGFICKYRFLAIPVFSFFSSSVFLAFCITLSAPTPQHWAHEVSLGPPMSHLCAQSGYYTVRLKALFVGRWGKPYFAHNTVNHFTFFCKRLQKGIGSKK